MAGKYSSYLRKMETKIRLKILNYMVGMVLPKQKRGQQFGIDIEVSTSIALAINSDDINKRLITAIYMKKW